MLGVVTGIPMEFQFGTNWSHFSRFAGGVIGQTLAMEGLFAFFLESTFLGLFLYGEKRLSKGMHWFAAFMVFLGSWLSGYFIVATDAWMQNPVGYEKMADGNVQLTSFWQLVLNPWALVQYAHNMSGAVITGAFVMAAVGSFLPAQQEARRAGPHLRPHRRDCRADLQCPATVSHRRPRGQDGGAEAAGDAGRDGSAVRHPARARRWSSSGTRTWMTQTIDNAIVVPKMLSFLTYRRWNAEVKGLNEVPQGGLAAEHSAAVLRLPHHGGAGTIFIAVTVVAAFLLWRGKLYNARWMLWILLLLPRSPTSPTPPGG